ncbi:hypothetical protein P3H15_49995 [Rhodococcus sp. T2V]|uniref:hypothetical protein n=1 Tax=Rhodococcus sp. T2V TaxID=3034164 RepID=UPI0023E1D7F8|nr:hypothetical protein [Rhodococcus sp. T2V]MDF3313057.1 hypothetical protein [Rhodococcus sp. T2V]
MMERPDPGGPTRRERYELLVAANLAQENAFEILASISRSRDRDDAAARLRERYSLSPQQAELIPMTPYRSMTQQDRARTREELDVLRRDLDAE